MVTIQIQLLTNQFGAAPWSSAHNEGKTEIIPSPVRILRAILSGLYSHSYEKTGTFDQLDEVQRGLFERLSQSVPSYYIPAYTHAGTISYTPDYYSSLRNLPIFGKENQASSRILFDPFISFEPEDSAIYVFYPVTLTGSQRSALSASFKYLNYLGRSEYAAKWKLLTRNVVEANCFPHTWGESVEMVNADCDDLLRLMSTSPEQLKHEGYRLPPFIEMGFYKLDAVRSTKAIQDSQTSGQVAYLSIDPGLQIPASQRLILANVLHKYLCKATSHPQAIGRYPESGVFIEKDQALYILTSSTDENYISGIRVLCKTAIDDSIIKALQRLKFLDMQHHSKIAVQLLGVKKRDPFSSTTYKTVVPALLDTEARNSIRRSPEAILLRNAIYQFAEQKPEITYSQEGTEVVATSETDLGSVKCRALPIGDGVIPFRGSRMGASSTGYYVVLEFEKPVDIVSVGAHYRFGMGELIPFSK